MLLSGDAGASGGVSMVGVGACGCSAGVCGGWYTGSETVSSAGSSGMGGCSGGGDEFRSAAGAEAGAVLHGRAAVGADHGTFLLCRFFMGSGYFDYSGGIDKMQ